MSILFRYDHVPVFANVNSQNSPGFSDEHSWVFLAEDPEPAEAAADSLEERYLRVERVPLDGVTASIARGEITDAKTIIGLTLTLLRRG